MWVGALCGARGARGHLLELLRGGLVTWGGAARALWSCPVLWEASLALVSTLRAAFTLKCSLLAVEIYQDFRRGFLWGFLSFLLGVLPPGSSPRYRKGGGCRPG